MKKLTETQWVEYFKTVHGRQPTANEYSQAKNRGDFQVSRKKDSSMLVMYGFLGLLLAIICGVVYFGIRESEFSSSETIYDTSDSTIDFVELEENDYSSIEGKWIAIDGSGISLKFTDEGLSVLNIKTENRIGLNGKSPQTLTTVDLDDGTMSAWFTEPATDELIDFTFYKAGVPFGDSDDYYDRIYIENDDVFLYRYDEVVDYLSEPFADLIDFVEEGDTTSLAGKWVSVGGDKNLYITVNDDSTMVISWFGSKVRKIENLKSDKPGHLSGSIGPVGWGQIAKMTVIPAGFESEGELNKYSDRDRIVLSDENFGSIPAMGIYVREGEEE